MERRDRAGRMFLKERRSEAIDMSLQTPETLRTFQRKLSIKAKEEPAFRCYSL